VRLVKRHQVELIHCNEHEHYPLFRHVGRWAGVPVVATLHWNLEPSYGHWAFGKPYTPAAIQFLSRKQLELSRPGLPPGLDEKHVRLLMSGLAIDDLLARGGDGSDLRAAWGVGPDTVVIGNASSLRPRKRLEDVIRLVARLRRRGLPVFGAIAGGGKSVTPGYPEQLQQVLREEKAEDFCKLVGFVSPVTPFFRACDVLLHTSDMEILSMSLCESQACGKPTLAYAVGGNPETLPGPWYVAELGDQGALEEKLVKLVTDADFRARCGEEAERWVREQFDAPVLAARQARIYEDILGPRFAPARAAEPTAVGVGV